MKDFFSKVTFGFLMAQLVPGMIVILSFSVLCVAFWKGVDDSLLAICVSTLKSWFQSGLRQIAFVALSTGAGMLIHGIQWATLGFLEHKYQSAINAPWHNNKWLVFQVLMGPVMIVWEMFLLFFRATNLKDVATTENVPYIDKDKIESFNFLQDFYLHFAQFYSHTSFALLVCLFSFGLSIFRVEYLFPHVVLLFVIYLSCGLFYVIGRIQFQSLFQGEQEIINPPPP